MLVIGSMCHLLLNIGGKAGRDRLLIILRLCIFRIYPYKSDPTAISRIISVLILGDLVRRFCSNTPILLYLLPGKHKIPRGKSFLLDSTVLAHRRKTNESSPKTNTPTSKYYNKSQSNHNHSHNPNKYSSHSTKTAVQEDQFPSHHGQYQH